MTEHNSNLEILKIETFLVKTQAGQVEDQEQKNNEDYLRGKCYVKNKVVIGRELKIWHEGAKLKNE